MDYKLPSLTHLVPSYTWVGPQELLVPSMCTWLQQFFCADQGCTMCIICQQIVQRQHQNIIWLKPQKQVYTLDCLSSIFDTIRFKQATDTHTFFIIQSAELLSDICAHALLKSVEEPPFGYHFIFLTSSLAALLPTLQSRSLTWYHPDQQTKSIHPLVLYFTQPPFHAHKFLEIITSQEVPTHETVVVLNQLIQHYSGAYQKNRQPIYRYYVSLLLTHIKRRLIPGSEKLFWQTLFFQFLHHPQNNNTRT